MQKVHINREESENRGSSRLMASALPVFREYDFMGYSESTTSGQANKLSNLFVID
jgi:hypothetical protein